MHADVMDMKQLHSLVVDHNIDWLVHFSALLSAVGEENVSLALKVKLCPHFVMIQANHIYRLKATSLECH